MSIIGIGTDLVQLTRIEALFTRYGDRFVERILSAHEKSVLSGMQDKIPFIAKRFAAKEAVAKALGCGIGESVAFTEISIENLPSGKPQVVLLGKAQALLIAQGIKDIHISLSDEKEYALAFVIVSSQSHTA
jgi:holo-[acyl-carrier protein] synthase